MSITKIQKNANRLFSHSKSYKGSNFSITVWKQQPYSNEINIIRTENPNLPRVRNLLSNEQVLKVLHLSQQQACKKLKCSLSVLKRKFYEMRDEIGLKRWPQYFHEIRHLPIFKEIYPMNLNFILNKD